MKPIFISIFVLFSLAGRAQISGGVFNASKAQAFNKSATSNGSHPLDYKAMYHDTIHFVDRPFTSVAEANSFLPSVQRVIGLQVVINTGGTVSGTTGLLTGGTNDLYYYKNGIADGNLVLLVTGGYDSTLMASVKRLKDTAAAIRTAPGNDADLIFNNSNGYDANDLYIIAKNFPSLCLGCNLPSGNAFLQGGGGAAGIFNVSSQAGELELQGDTVTARVNVGSTNVFRAKTNNQERLKIKNDGSVLFPTLTSNSDTTANKPGAFNPTTKEFTYLDHWPAAPGGNTPALQAVTAVGATTTIPTTFDSSYSENKLINEGLTIGDTLSLFTDSTWFVGTSLTFDKNATGHANCFAALTATALGSVEVNKGVPGTTLAPGANSIFNRLTDVPNYRSSIRYLMVELGTNDRPASPSDTVVARGYYASFWDTVLIARGWSAHKDRVICVVSPPVAVSTTPAVNMQWLATMEINLAHEKGITKIADTYTYLVNHGGALNISSDSLHESDLGHLNMKKSIMYALTDKKTNGNLLVNGPGYFKGLLNTTGNLSVSGNSSFSLPITIANPVLNTPSIRVTTGNFFGGGQFTSAFRIAPHPLNPANDSFDVAGIIQSGYRMTFDISHNGNSISSWEPTAGLWSFNSGKNTMDANGAFTALGPITARAIADNTPYLTLTSTNTAASPGITNSIYFKQGVGGPNDEYYFDYTVGSGYHNYFKLRHNSTDVWRVNESTNAVPFQFLVNNIGFAAATTAGATFNIPSGTAPSSPNDGDLWYDATHLYFRKGGTSKDLLASSGGTDSVQLQLIGNSSGIEDTYSQDSLLYAARHYGPLSVKVSRGSDSSVLYQLENDSSLTAANHIYSTNAAGRKGWYQGPTSGRYTPTISNQNNIDATTARIFHWTRIGDEITVDGTISFSITAGPISFNVSLPPPGISTFPTIYDLTGNITFDNGTTVGGAAGIVKADTVNGIAYCSIYSPTSNPSGDYHVHFVYTYVAP